MVAPSLYKMTRERQNYNQLPMSLSFKLKYQQSQFSPTRRLLTGSREVHEILTFSKKIDLPSLTNEPVPENPSNRSCSLNRSSKQETPTILNKSTINKDQSPNKASTTPEIKSNPLPHSISPLRMISTTPNKLSKILILEPIYIGGSPVVLFNYPPQCFKESRINNRVRGTNDFKLRFHVSSAVHTYNCVVNTFLFAGFQQKDHNYNVLVTGVPTVNIIREFNCFQKINHFPASKQLGRKDNLWKNINSMRRKFGQDYEICPKTYVIPEDYEVLQSTMETEKILWILKPAASSCGKGIKVVKSITDIPKKNRFVVSKYISDPHTINGYKYDLRVYVCVTSYDPLRVYLYQDGLVRFATEQYKINKRNLKKRFIHLTNFSVNKKSKNFIKVQSDYQDGEGSKWSFQALRKKYSELGIDFDAIFMKIEEIIIKTLISVEGFMISSLSSQKYRNTCFELYGFDILIDSKLRPWLLEVNILPSLSSSSPMDKKIKTSLMCDMFTLTGIVPYEKADIPDEKAYKNPFRNISNLQSSNSLEDYVLSEDDIKILLDCEEESYRTGNFRKIFPLKKNIDYYSGFFQVPRYNNILLWKHLKSSFNILNKCLKRQHQAISV